MRVFTFNTNSPRHPQSYVAASHDISRCRAVATYDTCPRHAAPTHTPGCPYVLGSRLRLLATASRTCCMVMLENRFLPVSQRVCQLARAPLPETDHPSQQAGFQQRPSTMPISASTSPPQPKYPHLQTMRYVAVALDLSRRTRDTTRRRSTNPPEPGDTKSPAEICACLSDK